MAIPELGSMMAVCSKCAKRKRKWLSQSITDVQPRDDMAALPTMARTQGSTMNSPFGRSPTAAAQSQSQTCQLMGHAIRRHIRGELPRGTP